MTGHSYPYLPTTREKVIRNLNNDPALYEARIKKLIKLCEDAIDLSGDATHLSLRKLTERKQHLKKRLHLLS